MADRVIMLGPLRQGDVVEALEVTPMDAAAHLNDGKWRVGLSLYSGELANATVLVREQGHEWGKDESAVGKRKDNDLWEMIQMLSPRGVSLFIDTPISLAECRAS